MAKHNKAIIVLTIIGVIALVLASIGALYYINKSPVKKTTSSSTSYKTQPLPAVDRQQVLETIEQSPFTQDLPSSGVISLKFYKFENGERVWQDGFLIGPGKILQSGEPDLSIIMHSKYIKELETQNLCDVIQEAQKNGDFATQLNRNKAVLLAKYSGMVKYRGCLGF